MTQHDALAAQAKGLEHHEDIERFRERLYHATSPLPGSTPYRRQREFSVTGKYDGSTLGGFLTERFGHVGEHKWRFEVESGRVQVEGHPERNWDRRVRPGMRLHHDIGMVTEPDIATDIHVLYNDEHFIALDKPAPLAVHPSGRFLKNTLIPILEAVLPNVKLRPPHRLDADTSGVQLLGKTREAAAQLTHQFAARAVTKQYLARVTGHPELDTWQVDSEIGRHRGRTGRRDLAPGDTALTAFHCLQRHPHGRSLVLATPKTGRTNQIRLHLKDCGHPICGDQIYGNRASDDSDSQAFTHGTLELHAFTLEFKHPIMGHAMRLVAPCPAWAKES